MMAICELYDATIDDFEKILKLDYLLYKGPDGGSRSEEGDLPKNVVRMQRPKSKPKGKR
jgi:hypothetical protein